jgi:subtilase family serine protease
MAAGVPQRACLYLTAFGLLLVLVAGAGTGSADPGGQVFRDHGHGAWFKRVCDLSAGPIAGCEAQVVTDANGDPLAGSSPPATALGPPQFHGAYNLQTTSAGGSPIVAVVDAYDDPNAEADLATFDTQYGLPPCTTGNGCFTKVNQAGGTSYPVANSSWALEISLDIETVHSICQTCKVLLVEASSPTIASLGAAENEAAVLGAVTISNSWGSSENSAETSWDSAYLSHPGVAITASSGDGGYGVEWPAASPDVTAVGGTTLTVGPGNSYGGESAWADGGSGCSAVEAKPSWQAGLGCTMRSVVDVAADADPNTGAAVYDSVSYQGQSGWYQVGGTSLSSPLIASVYALADDTSTISSGSTPYAYRGTGALHDVTTGSNGSSCSPSYLCNAGVGYDGPTGVGTPDGITAFAPGGSPPSPPSPPPAPDFSLAVSGQSGSPVSGTAGSATYAVSVTPENNFLDSVSLSATGLPTGVTASFSPSSTTSSSTLTITVGPNAASGTTPITITGQDGSLSHSVGATLTIAAPAVGFAIGVSPPAQTIGRPGSTTYTVTITPQNGFAGTVSLSVSGVPNRVNASFSPSSATAGSGWTSSLKVSSGSRARPGTSTLTIRGRSGTLSQTATASLTLN